VTGLVVLTADPDRQQLVVTGHGAVDLPELAGVPYRVTAAGSVVVALDALGDIEAAAAIRRRPVRLQSRREAAR